jgi:hypothetical protein
MSDVAYFEYALVLPEERYLIEVQNRSPATGQIRGEAELQQVATEALTKVVGQGRQDLEARLKANPIAEADALKLAKVQQLANTPDYTVSLVE